MATEDLRTSFSGLINMGSNEYQTRDPVEDIWGPRTPYKHEWPTRVDERSIEEADKWVQSACVLCRFVHLSSDNVPNADINVK